MSVGAYGQTIPIHIDRNEINDTVDIFYTYHQTRTYDSIKNSKFERLDSGVLQPCERNAEDGIDTVVEGMYTLQLPLNIFNKKGFYTVYIQPKEIEAKIIDVGNLMAFPNVRGIVLDTEEIKNETMRTKAKDNNALVGYRVILLDDKGKRMPYYRIVTSSNKTEAVIQAPNSSSDKSVAYRYDDASQYIFMTLSPTTANSFKANAIPYIGKPGERIILVNTLFEPIAIDIEMETHNADTISWMLENSQLRDLDNGLVTTYNDRDEIYEQTEFYTLKDQYSGVPVFEVKKKRDGNIDFTQTITDK